MPFGIYLHLPFCRVHCSYCAFAISTNSALEERYVAALLREIDHRADGREVTSIYLGGGTPSRMDVANIAALLARVRERFSVGSRCEISIEANPEDVGREALEEWQRAGVNRLSIGVQSFHDEELIPLGRVHGGRRAGEAVADAVASGLRTSLDLMAGLPSQTPETLARSVDLATATGAGHVSLYMLDLEDRTPLQVQVASGRTTLPEDETVVDMYLDAVERLTGNGIAQYEISNFARAGEESRHNLGYWRRDDYFGFGIAAHSFLGEVRFANTRDIQRYIDNAEDAIDFRETLGAEERRRERLFLYLRQVAGIDYEVLNELAGKEASEWADRGLTEGWLRQNGRRVGFTPRGFVLSSEYISQLF